ncbi:MAG TPA: hypothetical protein VF941_02890 [Clostridia bacterium]
MATSARKILTGAYAIDEDRASRISKENIFQTQDATGTPITSPKTVSSSVITLIVPTNAIAIVIICGTNLVRVSEDSAVANYAVLPSNVPVEFPVTQQNNVYLLRDGASDATVQFFFKCL